MKLWIILGIIALLGGGTAATVMLLPEQPEPAPVAEEATEQETASESTSDDTSTDTETSDSTNTGIDAGVTVGIATEVPETITSIEDDLDVLVFDDLDAELEDLDVDFDLGGDIDFGTGF